MIGSELGFKAQVEKATYVGVRMEYSLKANFGAMFAVQDDVDSPLEVGTEIVVGFHAKSAVLLPEA